MSDIDIASIFQEQLQEAEKNRPETSSEEITEQLKASLINMDNYLKGNNPNYPDIKIRIY